MICEIGREYEQCRRRDGLPPIRRTVSVRFWREDATSPDWFTRRDRYVGYVADLEVGGLEAMIVRRVDAGAGATGTWATTTPWDADHGRPSLLPAAVEVEIRRVAAGQSDGTAAWAMLESL